MLVGPMGTELFPIEEGADPRGGCGRRRLGRGEVSVSGGGVEAAGCSVVGTGDIHAALTVSHGESEDTYHGTVDGAFYSNTDYLA